MKKIFIIALALVSFTINAQDKKEDRLAIKKERLSKMNAEERSEIQTKKMVLALDLTEAQQKQVQKLNLESAKLRIEGMKNRMAAAEKKEKSSHKARLKMKNDKLDHRIANKRAMKNILTEAQYKKWSKTSNKRHMKGKRKKREMMKKKRGRDLERGERRKEREPIED